jgi:hypothetical protein
MTAADPVTRLGLDRGVELLLEGVYRWGIPTPQTFAELAKSIASTGQSIGVVYSTNDVVSGGPHAYYSYYY